MKAIVIAEGIYRLGVNLDATHLFEGMWPMPDGISINSYVVQGEKTALIDLVEDIDDKPVEFEQELNSIPLRAQDIDYLVINHMEPDHTGWLPEFYSKNPNIEIYITEKGAAMLKAFCGIEENVHVVKTGDTLDLGGNKELVFYEIPNLHWPETMATYERNSGILFSCDAFGSYGSITDTLFDDQLSSDQHNFFMNEALRYYANIISNFSMFVEKAISKLKTLDIKMIAPSHGLIWRENPQEIIDTYSRFAGYLKGPAEAEVTLIWSSMYGNTQKVVNAMVEGVRSEGIPIHIHRVPNDHIGFILASAMKSSGIILGMPTYEYKMFPPMAWTLDMFGRKKIWNKKVLRFGSFGWSGGAQQELEQLTEKLKWTFVDPVEWQGAPSEDVVKQAALQAKKLAQSLKQ
ncbi:MAG: FprA family A-type flavoprotein [Proteobacteria bacterium]|nr:FprA family A-type flavoprotein [Pseudomonadota bacterium]MBU1649916.1 FprA family A-type flavoprotein [Pseudomonadota bacterium]